MEVVVSTPKQHDFVPGHLFKFDTPKLDTPSKGDISSFFSPFKRFSFDFGACFSPKSKDVETDLTSGVDLGTREQCLDSSLLSSRSSKFDFSFAEVKKPNLNFIQEEDTHSRGVCGLRFTAKSVISRRLSFQGCHSTPKRRLSDRHSWHRKRRLWYFQNTNEWTSGQKRKRLDWKEDGATEVQENVPDVRKPLGADTGVVARKFNSNRNKVRILSSLDGNNGKCLSVFC